MCYEGFEPSVYRVYSCKILIKKAASIKKRLFAIYVMICF